jgi:regulator of sirC expression with transglutaminase-like and TPR domain
MTLHRSPSRQLLADALARPEPALELGRMALLVAQEEYPQLPVEGYLTRLDALAERTRDHLGTETAPLLVLEALTETLFGAEGFQGNRSAYYDPRNSFLNDVLDRKVGIPLTLGILMLEVGWRLDLPLEGVNFPGHFLVRFRGETLSLLLDPFSGGHLCFEDEAQTILDRSYGGMVRMKPDFLKVAGKREMLLRLLLNLKGIYMNVQDLRRALTVVDRILMLRPMAAGEVRDRGTILARLGRAEDAIEQFEWYLGAAPEAEDAPRIRALVEALRGTRRRRSP